MFLALLIIGGFLSVLGGIVFIIDAFRVHWGWGLSVMFIPLANIVCLIKHWAATKRGFLLTLLALPFLAGALFVMPKNELSKSASKPEKINDPFFNAMQKARAAMGKVQESRNETVPSPVVTPASPSQTNQSLATATPLSAVPTLTLSQRLGNNRASFKSLEADFATMNNKRKALPKNDSKAIAAFNLEAKAYADKLAEVRSEQAILLELQKNAKK